MSGFLDSTGVSVLWNRIKDSKQDKLTGTPGQVVGFSADGRATTVQGWSNSNLLINADFRSPVNSGGQTEYVGAVNGIDGWSNGSRYTCVALESDGITISQNSQYTSSAVKIIYQRIDTPKSVAGKQITLSSLVSRATAEVQVFLNVESPSGNENIALSVSKSSDISSNKPFILSSAARIPDDTTNLIVQLRLTGDIDGTATFTAAKLELGDHQTLAHQDADGNWVLNDPPPDKNVESLKCQPMTTADLSGLIYQCAYPTNKLIFDSAGKPGAYVYIPKFRLCDVLSTTDTSVHPAFIRDGKEVDGFWMGKFQSSVEDGKAYSLPAKDPRVNVTLDQAVAYNRAKGGKFHEVTAAEWAAVALWCHKNGTEPKGNNNYGKGTTETMYQAIPANRDGSGRTTRVLTGTGPVTWSHDGTLEGIWDLNGNIWEWTAGIRLVKGELQVIPYNDAADPNCDTSASSNRWKPINAAATGYADLFVTPNGQGTTAGTVKLDWATNHWQWAVTISGAAGAHNAAFATTTYAAGLSAFTKMYLQAMALGPEEGADASAYQEDHFYAVVGVDERCAFRSGDGGSSVRAGVFALHFGPPRSDSSSGVGGRSAYQE